MKNQFEEHKIFIFTGHFGSGKTQTAANFAVQLKRTAENVNIVDLDIVNPFFRTTDFKDFFENRKINVVGSQFAGSNIEIPSVPSNLPLILNQADSKTIIDVGGDEEGARILRGYKEYVKSQNYIMYCVINIRRPETDSVPKIKSMINQIEAAAGIKVTSLINNTNLSQETSIKDIIEGDRLISEVSSELKIPIGFVCAEEDILMNLPEYISGERLTHRVKMPSPWG